MARCTVLNGAARVPAAASSPVGVTKYAFAPSSRTITITVSRDTGPSPLTASSKRSMAMSTGAAKVGASPVIEPTPGPSICVHAYVRLVPTLALASRVTVAPNDAVWSGPAFAMGAMVGGATTVKDELNDPSIGSPSAARTPATVTVCVELPGKGSTGVKVAVDPVAETVPAIVPTRNELVVTEAGSTARLNVTVTVAVALTAVAPFGGATDATASAVGVGTGLSVTPDPEHAWAMRIASAPMID